MRRRPLLLVLAGVLALGVGVLVVDPLVREHQRRSAAAAEVVGAAKDFSAAVAEADARQAVGIPDLAELSARIRAQRQGRGQVGVFTFWRHGGRADPDVPGHGGVPGVAGCDRCFDGKQVLPAGVASHAARSGGGATGL